MIAVPKSPAEAPSQKLKWELVHTEPGVLVYSIPSVEDPHPLIHRTVGRSSGHWVPGGEPATHVHPVKHSALHHAEYIGRVGVLAAALGVGAAIAGTPGIAWAEPAETDSTTSTTTSTEDDSAEDDSRTAETDSGRETTSSSATSTTESADADGEETAPDESAQDEDEVQDEDEDEVEDTTAPAAIPDAPTDTTAPADNGAEVDVPAPDAPSETVELPSAATRDTATPSTATMATGGSTANPSAEPVMLIPTLPEEQSAIAEADITTGGPPVSAAAATTAAESAPPPISSVPETPASAGAVNPVVETVLVPVAATDNPAVQAAQTPAPWNIFAWSRRTYSNATPVLSYHSTTTSQLDNIITGHVIPTDSDTLTLTLTASAPVNGGTVVMHPDGTFIYTVPANRSAGGTDTFTVTATDSHSPAHIHGLAGLLNAISFGLMGNPGHTASTTVTLNIAAVPAPIPGTPAYTLGAVQHGTGAVPGTLRVTDSDTVTYTLTGGPTDGNVRLDADTGAFVYTPTSVARHEAAAENATPDQLADTFTVTVGDGHGGVISVPVAVTIDPSNSPPTMTLAVSDPDRAGTVHVTVTVADPDNDPTSYLVINDPAYGTLTQSPGGYDYTPNAAAATNGADTLTVTASDLHHGTVTETATVTVSPVNVALSSTTVVDRSSTDIKLPIVATVFTLRGWSSLGWLTPDRMSQQFGGIFTEAPYTLSRLDYPAKLGSTAISAGVTVLDAALMSTPGDIIVMAQSQGAQVASQWMRQYASDPIRAALAGRVTFLLTGNTLRADSGRLIGGFINDGSIGKATPTTTPWPIIDVARRWDGWADAPDDATNGYAARNARAGQTYLHAHYDDVNLYDSQNTVWRDGNTTFVLTHEDHLPMFRGWLFVPADFESVVRAKVEAGYNRPSNDIPVPVQQIQSLRWQQTLQILDLKYGT